MRHICHVIRMPMKKQATLGKTQPCLNGLKNGENGEIKKIQEDSYEVD